VLCDIAHYISTEQRKVLIDASGAGSIEPIIPMGRARAAVRGDCREWFRHCSFRLVVDAQGCMAASPKRGDCMHALTELAEHQAVPFGFLVEEGVDVGTPAPVRRTLKASDAFIASRRCEAAGATT
jgi:hypothetical protein